MTARRHLAFGLAVGTLALASAALSSPLWDPYDPYELPDAPAPPTAPDLTHRGLALTFDMTAASIQPITSADARPAPRMLGVLERIEAEQALSIRRFYVGAALGVASGAAPTKVALSHPELWGRAVWASRAGLAFGGGLGFVIPTFRYAESTRTSLIEGHIRVVRPWDYPSFNDHAFTFRPFVDVRAIDGPVTLQLRQGIDWALPTNGGEPLIASRTIFYVGYRASELVQVGLEASEVYFIRAPNVSDEERATYTLSPSVRFMTRRFQPSVSAIFPLDQTVLGVADSFWALRMQLTMILD